MSGKRTFAIYAYFVARYNRVVSRLTVRYNLVVTLTQSTLGTADLATAIAQWHIDANMSQFGTDRPIPAGFRLVGSGAQRTAYLHAPTGTVYKVGDSAANRYEQQTFTKLRAVGHAHIPASELHAVETVDRSDCWLGVEARHEQLDVICLPYLPEDGSVPKAGVWLPGMADLNPANVHAHAGQLWLIDAGGL